MRLLGVAKGIDALQLRMFTIAPERGTRVLGIHLDIGRSQVTMWRTDHLR